MKIKKKIKSWLIFFKYFFRAIRLLCIYIFYTFCFKNLGKSIVYLIAIRCLPELHFIDQLNNARNKIQNGGIIVTPNYKEVQK